MKLKNIAAILAALALVAGIFVALVFGSPSLGVAAATSVGQEQAADKIEPLLLEKFSAEGQVDFIALFAEQADLSKAYTLGWKERGEYVFNTLTEVARRTQAEAKAYLDSRGLSYTTFIAGNELYVKTGDQAAALALADMPAVSYLRATRVYKVDPVVQASSVYAGVAGPAGLVARRALITVAAPPGSAQAPAATFAWGITDTAADDFWNSFGVEGDGIVVANIDTGVDYTHDALQPNYKCGGGPHDNCWEDPGAADCSGPGGGPCDTIYAGIYHGTHTMGTMAADNDPGLAYTVGMAPNAQWIACLGCPFGSCPDFDLNTCADWMLAPGGNADNRPHVVNNSWGGGGGDPWYMGKVNAWSAAGIFPAFSAGNSGPSCSSLGSPGDYQESFGSASHNSSRNISSFSSRGPSVYGHDPYTKPNISAPGENVISTAPGDGWATISGTSMASPHSAGAVALLWSCNPSLVGQVDLTFQALQNFTDVAPAGACGAPPDGQGNYTYGYGYLNAYNIGLNNCGVVDLGYLDGYVFDTDTGNPLEGASVNATPGLEEVGVDAITDPTGYYTMTLLPGIYDVTASKYGYFPQTVTGIEILTDTVTSQDFSLTFQGAWSPGTDTPFDFYRYDCTWFDDGTGPSEFNEKVYCMGGRNGSTTELPDIWRYDPVADVWSDTGDNIYEDVSNYTPNLLMDENYATDGLAIYVVGGTDRDNAGVMVNLVQRYYPMTGLVQNVTTDPWPGKVGGAISTPGNCASALGNTKIFCFGGWNNLTSPYNTNDTYVFDPSLDPGTRWEQITTADLSVAREYIQAAVQDGLIYAMGGDEFDGAELDPTTIVEVLDTSNPEAGWTVLASMPVASGEGRGFGFDADTLGINAALTGKLYVVGGGDWSGSSPEVMEYDIATDTWNQAFPDLITSRRNHGGVFIPLCTEDPSDGMPGMWVFGGYAGSDSPPYGDPEYFPFPCGEPAPELELQKSADPDVTLPGNPVTYTLEFTNTGDADALGALITDTLPAEVVYLASDPAGVYDPLGHTLSWTVDISAGVSGEATIWVEVDAATPVSTTVVNSAVLVWDGQEPVIAEDSFFVAGVAPQAGFTYAAVGLTVNFTNTTIPGVPAETSFLWDFDDGNTSTDENPSHAFAASGDYGVSLTATNDWASDLETITVTVVASADLSLTKTAEPGSVAPGGTITYTLMVANSGPDGATGVSLSDTLPTGVVFVSASAGCSEAGGVVTCDLGDLAAGGDATVVIVVTAPEEAGTLTNMADVTANELDENTENNAASVDTTVEEPLWFVYLPFITRP